MPDATDEDLRRRTEALLEPGDVALDGVIVHTDLAGDEEIALHEVVLDVGDIVARHAGVEDWYVYSGNDDPEFASNQHQGLDFDDEFVWECQTLLREGTFDLVVYYEASADHDGILAALRAAGYRVTGVEGG